MTEKDKMLRGMIYDANFDTELLNERTACKELCRDYNDLRPSDFSGRNDLIHKIIGHIKGNIVIEQPFYCDYGYNISVGNNFFANYNLVILDEALVTFGSNVFVGPNCSFYTACHPIDPVERNKGLEYARGITVGDNVWFGGNVTVLPGVTIGDNCVIGAGSVVTHDIPANTIACGNPCKVIRTIDCSK